MAFAYATLIQFLVHIHKARHWNPAFIEVRGLFAMDFRDASISPTVFTYKLTNFRCRFFHEVLSSFVYRAVWIEVFFPPLYMWHVAQCLIYCTYIKPTLHTGFKISYGYFSSQNLIILLSLICAMKASLDCFYEALAFPVLFCRLEPGAQRNTHRFI